MISLNTKHVALFLLANGLANYALAQGNIQTLLWTGKTFPDLNETVKTIDAVAPIAPTGKIALLASGQDGRKVILKGDSAQVRTVAREGLGTPPVAYYFVPAKGIQPWTATYNTLFEPTVNNNGQISFVARLNPNARVLTNVSDMAIFTDATQDGTLAVVARQGVGDLTSPDPKLALHNDGRTFFRAGIQGAGSEGIWHGGPQRLEQTLSLTSSVTGAEYGKNAPGVSGVFSAFAVPQYGFGSHNLLNAGVAQGGDRSISGLWRQGATLELVMAQGSVVPGRSSTTFQDVVSMSIRGEEIVFSALYADGNGGLWHAKPGVLQKIVQSGENAPGIPAGEIWDMGIPAVNGSGTVAFTLEYMGGFNSVQGVWSGGVTNPEPLMLGGVQARDMPAGVLYDTFIKSGEIFDATPSLFVNALGYTAFSAKMKGPTITVDSDEGIWMGTHGFVWRVVREGNQIEGKTVRALRLLGIDDTSRVYFEAQFTDFTVGIFSWTPGAFTADGGFYGTGLWHDLFVADQSLYAGFVWSPWMGWMWVPDLKSPVEAGWVYNYTFGWFWVDASGQYFWSPRYPERWLWTTSVNYPHFYDGKFFLLLPL